MSTPEDADPPSALPRGTRLGEFEIRRVLGIGGFGIVYLAFDHALEREVAVKEYMPASLAGRTAAMHVSLLSQAHAETFALGLRSFVNEARLLARFDHPSLVKVHRYWEANQTAYMAMPYYTGSNLQRVRRQMSQPPDEAWIRAIVEPLLGAIERLHGEAVYHRDISPDNVILQPDGRPVLLDFGAARRVLSDKSMALTAILKPAYAPIEQYAEAGAVKQGPWTDLYSLGATVHFLLLGKAPPPATARTVQDDAQPLAQQALPGCSPLFLQCVDWMLRPRPTDRPQSVAALREVLAGRADVPDSREQAWARTQIMPGASEATVVMPRAAAPVPAPPVHAAESRAAASAPPAASAPAPSQPVSPPATPATGLQAARPASAAPAAADGARRAPVVLAGLAAVAVVAGGWWALRPGQAPAVTAVPAAPLAASAAASAPVVVSTPTAAPTPAPVSAPAPAPVAAVSPPAAASATVATASAPVPAAAGARPAASAARVAAASAPPRLPASAMAPRANVRPDTSNTTSHSAATSATSPYASPAPVDTPRNAAPAATPGYGSSSAPTTATAPPARATQREPDPMVQARVLGPSERCEGRVLLAYQVCIENQCKLPELRDHPECAKQRREQDQRNGRY